MSLLNGKKFKELQSENDELKKIIDGLSEKENRYKNFEELIKKARLDFAEITTKKDQTAQKLETFEKEKTKLLGELSKISSEIKQLREIKLSEQNQILSLSNSADQADRVKLTPEILSKEIDEAEKRKNDIALETFKLRKNFEETGLKINDSKKVLTNLNSEIERKKEELSSLIERQMLVSDEQYKSLSLSIGNKSIDEIHLRVDKLIRQEKELTDMVTSRKQILTELDRRIGEKKQLMTKESDKIKTSEKTIRASSSRMGIVAELEIKIDAMEAQLARLTNEFNTKNDLFNELQSDTKQLSENLKVKNADLIKLNESIEIATAEIKDLDHSLNVLDQEFKKISKEISLKMSLKENLETDISEMKNKKSDFEDTLQELKETITILAQLKNDIEKGSGQSAKRFTGVIQYYSTVINDIYKKKKDADKILSQKETEISEKQNALNEMKNVLLARQNKLKLFEDLTKQITNQRRKLESRSISSDVKNEMSDSILSQSISQKKLLEYENALKDLINSSDKYYGNLFSSKNSLEKEISENKKRLNELNQNIRQSTNELSELKDSINKIKIEHEEHRVSINNLTSIKTKLEEHIEQNQQVIEKYIKIKEKIKLEQEQIKKKREVTDSKTQNVNKEGEKSLDPHNPKWIKL